MANMVLWATVERDQEILRLASSGDYRNKQIAGIVGLSPITIWSILNKRFGFNEKDFIKCRNERLADMCDSGNYDLDRLCDHFGLGRLYMKDLIHQMEKSLLPSKASGKRKKIMELVKTGKYTLTEISNMTGVRVDSGRLPEVAIYREAKAVEGCIECGTPLSKKGKGSISLCLRCRKRQYKQKYLRNIICIECGISHPTSSRKTPECCSQFCDMAKRKRIKANRNRNIHSRADELRQAQSGISLREICRRLGPEFNLSPGGTMWVFQADIYNPPPLGWSSDRAVLRMNNWVTSETKVKLLLKARSFREKLIKQKAI